jgi:flagellar basal-body rod protein FlgC
MAFLNSLDISGSGLTASRLRMDVIAENLSNAETTRTSEGGPYRRKMVVYECADSAQTFRSMLEAQVNGSENSAVLQGVKVTGIVEDQTPFNVEYDPTNPDANDQGYVEKPNVDLIQETTDMMAASRAYNANLTAFDAVKNMAAKALELGK